VLLDKWSFAIHTFFRFIGQAVILSLIFVLLASLQIYFEAHHIFIADVFQRFITNPLYWLLFLVLIYVNGRMILYRLEDKEVRS